MPDYMEDSSFYENEVMTYGLGQFIARPFLYWNLTSWAGLAVCLGFFFFLDSTPARSA